MMRLLALSIVSIFFVAAFGERAFSKDSDTFMAHDAWAPPSLDGASVGTAFATLHNPTDTAIEVKSFASDVAKTVELHDHVMENGMMKMRRVDPVVIPAKGQIVMKPGSYHVMLIGLKRPLLDGETVSVTITPQKGAAQTITFPVSQARLLEALKSRNSSKHAH
ncbi:MAG: copper chaperone PCu(A)C [Alphaproteobacteria bacterium]|nr:copper chaperone PCu(A)C [Alphaproteobacteria bacterium]